MLFYAVQEDDVRYVVAEVGLKQPLKTPKAGKLAAIRHKLQGGFWSQDAPKATDASADQKKAPAPSSGAQTNHASSSKDPKGAQPGAKHRGGIKGVKRLAKACLLGFKGAASRCFCMQADAADVELPRAVV